eukprot:16446172-Heterocapsa_arctica.AAC.1
MPQPRPRKAARGSKTRATPPATRGSNTQLSASTAGAVPLEGPMQQEAEASHSGRTDTQDAEAGHQGGARNCRRPLGAPNTQTRQAQP